MYYVIYDVWCVGFIFVRSVALALRFIQNVRVQLKRDPRYTYLFFLPDSLATAVGSFQYAPHTLQFVEPVERSGRPQDHATCTSSLAAGAEYMSVGNMRQTVDSLYLGCTISVNFKHTLLLFYALLAFLEDWA